MLNLYRCMPTMARSDHTARLLQTLGYLTISRRNLHKLIVSGLPEETTYPYLSLLEYYTRFGEVRGYRVLDDSSSRVAFIYYDKIQAVRSFLEWAFSLEKRLKLHFMYRWNINWVVCKTLIWLKKLPKNAVSFIFFYITLLLNLLLKCRSNNQSFNTYQNSTSYLFFKLLLQIPRFRLTDH